MERRPTTPGSSATDDATKSATADATERVGAEADRGPLFGTYEWITDSILVNLPELRALQDGLFLALGVLSHATVAVPELTDPREKARLHIVSQASNDFLDLLYETASGRGRPAVRTARALFEHLVNYRSVKDDLVMAQRYCDHEAVGNLLDLRLNTPGEEEFTGTVRKRFRHWLSKAEKKYRPAAEEALRTYGSGFRSSWAGRTLFDRARSGGLESEYDFYRLCSAVMHGNASGTVGIRQEIEGHNVVRTGPAISLVPFALRFGTRYMTMLLHDLEPTLGREPIHRLLEVSDIVVENLANFTAVANNLDHRIWPDEPPRTFMFLKVFPGGARQWLLYSTENDCTIRAKPVELDAKLLERLDRLVAEMEYANPGRTKPCVIQVADARGIPLVNATWQPAQASLRKNALVVGDRPAYETIRSGPTYRDPSLYD